MFEAAAAVLLSVAITAEVLATLAKALALLILVSPTHQMSMEKTKMK
jgi:hypothetical protein